MKQFEDALLVSKKRKHLRLEQELLVEACSAGHNSLLGHFEAVSVASNGRLRWWGSSMVEVQATTARGQKWEGVLPSSLVAQILGRMALQLNSSHHDWTVLW